MINDPEDNEYKNLIGKRIFRGICNLDDSILIAIDDKVFEFVEDSDDGYRSYCNFIGEVKLPPEQMNKFKFNLEHTPLEVDIVRQDDSFDGLCFYGSDTFCPPLMCVYTVGTDNCNDYYPCCTNDYDAIKATEVYRLQNNHHDGILLQ